MAFGSTVPSTDEIGRVLERAENWNDCPRRNGCRTTIQPHWTTSWAHYDQIYRSQEFVNQMINRHAKWHGRRPLPLTASLPLVLTTYANPISGTVNPNRARTRYRWLHPSYVCIEFSESHIFQYPQNKLRSRLATASRCCVATLIVCLFLNLHFSHVGTEHVHSCGSKKKVNPHKMTSTVLKFGGTSMREHFSQVVQRQRSRKITR